MADAQDSGSCGAKPRGGSSPPIRTNLSGGLKMEKIAYLILTFILILWLLAMVLGFIFVFPVGLIGLLLILAFGLLFIKVLKERIESKSEEEKYKDIKW